VGNTAIAACTRWTISPSRRGQCRRWGAVAGVVLQREHAGVGEIVHREEVAPRARPHHRGPGDPGLKARCGQLDKGLCPQCKKARRKAVFFIFRTKHARRSACLGGLRRSLARPALTQELVDGAE
jgi:hypothetical protein